MTRSQDDTSIRIRRTLAATAPQIWAVLSDPRRHVERDGSGMLQAAADSDPLTQGRQVFSMDMSNRWNGDYRTDNTIVEFSPERRISWATAREVHQTPAGGTDVLHVYDWSWVVDPAVFARVQLPRVTPEELPETMSRLAAAT